jgi:hypothetical protein
VARRKRWVEVAGTFAKLNGYHVATTTPLPRHYRRGGTPEQRTPGGPGRVGSSLSDEWRRTATPEAPRRP